MAEQMKKERARRLFLIAFVLFTFANGFGGSIISNYFKGVYQVDSVQRGLLEIPRELPGVVGVFVITALSGCGNLTLAMISFFLYAVGMFVLGLLSPGYLLMQLFVFTYSLGDHIVMPVRDAIAMISRMRGRREPFSENTGDMRRWGPWRHHCLYLSGSGTGRSGSGRTDRSFRRSACHL